jgi:fructose-specific phosphotransferase system IIA component
MKLTEILRPDCIKVPLEALEKSQVIGELVGLLADQDVGGDRDSLLRAVLEREATRTTGIGNGLAIPHGKCDVCRNLVIAIGKPAVPIEFESIDNKPVDLVVLLASPPDQTGPHIQALAHISRIMSMDRFREALRAAPDAKSIYDIIVEYEKQ